MASSTVSARLDPEDMAALDALCAIKGYDRSTLIKILLRSGMKQMRLDQATDSYRRGEVTLSRAAELAGIPLLELMARMGTHDLVLHYDVEDLRQDREAFLVRR